MIHNTFRRILFFCVLFFLCGLSPVIAQPKSSLSDSIDRILDAEAFRNASWGVRIVDLSSGDIIYQHNARRSFVPASNAKLYTTLSALEQLGPDFRYQTLLYATGPVTDGILHGNLVVRGSGDPVIGGRFNNDDRTATFRAWADSIKNAGITQIQGDIIGDDDIFDDQPLGNGWSWDDEPYWYSAEISGLSYNDNCIDVSIQGQKNGMPGIVSWEPSQTDYVRVVNRTVTSSAGSSLKEGYARTAGTNTLVLSSMVPEGQVDTESLTISNPTLYFTHVLRETLLHEGIAILGNAVDVDDVPIKPTYDNVGFRRLATHASPPLTDIVAVINKESQNLYAEQLLKTIAAEAPTDDERLVPGSAEMGIAAEMATFVRAGIDTSRIQLIDGSGLSRMNLVTAEMTGQILDYAWNHPNPRVREAFFDSLPVGGTDGTLENRLSDPKLIGRVHAKTGTVSNVSTLSGYVRSDSGVTYDFVIMANYFTVRTSVVRDAQDSIVQMIVSDR